MSIPASSNGDENQSHESWQVSKTDKHNPNRVRDHLANERTYLAWMRTAVALLGFGVVIVRLRYLLPPTLQGKTNGWQLGLIFALVGLFMALLSNAHYFQIQRAIENDTYEPASRWIIASTTAVVLLGAGVLYYLLASPVNTGAGSTQLMP